MENHHFYIGNTSSFIMDFPRGYADMVLQVEVIQFTLPETNSEFAPEVMDGWNTTLWKINCWNLQITKI